jgi:hypothetical protein
MPSSGVFSSFVTAGLISCAAAPCTPKKNIAAAAANSAKNFLFMFSPPQKFPTFEDNPKFLG